MNELCCLFCCPPCPSKIVAKLAFLPPQPTYKLVINDDQTAPQSVIHQNGFNNASNNSTNSNQSNEQTALQVKQEQQKNEVLQEANNARNNRK